MVGERALGRFTLLERIGAGGFGTVYRGWDERLERPVAVKVIEAPGGAGRRVLREAQAAARLNHPGIVTLYELGERDGSAYLVSELVEGDTLDALARDGALSDRDVAELGVEICEALAHAHAHGVIHRDIKPQNVIVRDADDRWPDDAGRAKLMDFGTASLVDGPGLTATGEVIGTIAYMAPEQAEGDEAGSPADLYALALTLFEALAGRHPFARSTPAATARAIGEPIVPLARLRPDLPPGICVILDSCLLPEPDRRPGLDAVGGGLADAAPLLSDEQPVPQPAPHRREREPTPALIAAARLAGVGIITAVVAWLALVAGRPGTALVAAVLLLPAPLLFASPLQWPLPVAAPVLGAVGLAPVYPALASLAPTPSRRAVLALCGWAWLVAAEAILDVRLLFGTEAAPAGWSDSAREAATGVLLPMVAPDAVLVALVWAVGALVLGALIRGRMVALELLAALVWAAALLALHGVLAGEAPEPAALPLAVALVAVALITLWARWTRASRPAPAVGRSPPLA